MHETAIELIRSVDHAYDKACEGILEKYGIAKVSFDILMFLANNPSYTTAQEISDYRFIKKNLVSHHVQKLVELGLIERREVDGDRRKLSLICTTLSEPIISAGKKMQKSFTKKLTDGISERDLDLYLKMIKVITANAKNM